MAVTQYALIRIEMKLKQVFRIKTGLIDISKTTHNYPYDNPVRITMGSHLFVVDREELDELEHWDEGDSQWRDAFLKWMEERLNK